MCLSLFRPCFTERERERDRERDRDRDRQTDRQTETQTDRQRKSGGVLINKQKKDKFIPSAFYVFSYQPTAFIRLFSFRITATEIVLVIFVDQQ